MPQPPRQALWALGSDLCAQAAGRRPGFGASQEARAAVSWPGRHAAVATACVIFSRGAEPSLAWGHLHLPPPPPRPSSPSGGGGRGRCTQQPMLSAKSARLSEDAVRRGRIGLFFLFRISRLHREVSG